MSQSVLHVFPTLSRGGAGRGIAGLIPALAKDTVHSIVSLEPPDGLTAEAVRSAGAEVIGEPAPDVLRAAVEQADIVHVHFWNCPAIYEFLYSAELPPSRLLLYSHTAGTRRPQILTRELVDFADRAITSAHRPLDLAWGERMEAIPMVFDRTRVRAPASAGDRPFTVGYVGTVDFSKLHRDFIALCAAVDVPEARFVVCGEGGALLTLRREVEELGLAGRVELRGYVEDIGPALAEMDVFGYPLSDENSATGELALQEAMFAGVVPVVLGPGGARDAFIDGESGIGVDDAATYAEAIERLATDPAERLRLSRGAREHAEREFSVERVARLWDVVYAEMLDRDKTAKRLADPGPGGAARFVASLGDTGPEFEISLGARPGDRLEADRLIAHSPPAVLSDGGGILFYRDRYPSDAELHLWAGLALDRQGRASLAAGELAAAVRCGRDDELVAAYRRRATLAARLGAMDCTVVYMGASVTAQRKGFRPHLHAAICRRFGREHAMVNAGAGTIGTVGGLFMMERLALAHDPALAFVEYTTADINDSSHTGLIEEALEEIVIRLRGAGCEPCVLVMPRDGRGDEIREQHRRVAAHQGVCLIDVPALMAAKGVDGTALLRDGIHTTDEGAPVLAELIAGELDRLFDPTATAPGDAERLHPEGLQGARFVEASAEHVADPATATFGRYRLLYPYIELRRDSPLRLEGLGDLVGVLVTVTTERAEICVGDRAMTVVDPGNGYEYLTGLMLDPPLPGEDGIDITMTGGDREALPILGFMVSS